MSFLGKGKVALLTLSQSLGLTSRIISTQWRQQRLLVLGYHGVSLKDEHCWDGSLYMSPHLFRERLQVLADYRCNVLPLPEAFQRLFEGTLPPRAVILTFDDGFCDFHRLVSPMLREFGYPATVFWTTYYSGFNRPVFDLMLRYLLWKGNGRELFLQPLLDCPTVLTGEFSQAERAIREYAFRNGLSGTDKDLLLGRIASALDIDYEELCRQRLLHVMTEDEAAAIVAEGHQLQLHTHRHRVSRHREYFDREVTENRACIGRITSSPANHFCYPGGHWESSFLPWLRDAGIRTAVTCEPGLASRESNPLRLPRILDNSAVSRLEFQAWVTGLAALLPSRRISAARGQLLEDTVKNLPDLSRTPVR